MKFLIKLLTFWIPVKSWRKKIRNSYKNIVFRKKCKKNNNKVVVIKENGEKLYNVLIPGLDIKFLGKNSIIEINEPYCFQDCCINMRNNNFVKIGATKNVIL